MQNKQSEQLSLPSIPEEVKALRLSVSKVKCFLQCKKQYYFTYIVKLPRKDFEFHKLGRAIHLVLELFHSDFINGTIQPLNKVMENAYKTAMLEFGPTISAQSKKEIFDMADKYLQIITAEKSHLKSVVSVEKNFNIPITDKVVLNGMIDRVQIDPDGVYHICDYKTTKMKKYLANDFMQLLTYAYVMYMENKDIKTIRASYILLRHNFEYLTKEFSIDEVLKIKDQFETYAKSIEDEKLYEASPSRLCLYCSALEKCDDGQKFLGLQNVSLGKTTW